MTNTPTTKSKGNAMQSIIFRTIPGITACVRTRERTLLIIGATTDDGKTWHSVRLPDGMGNVAGRDPLETIGAAIGNRQAVQVAANADWNAEEGCWDVDVIDEIVDPRSIAIADMVKPLFDDAMGVELRSLEIGEDSLHASIRLTIDLDGLDGDAAEAAFAAQDAIIQALDDHDHLDWRFDVIDSGMGMSTGWWTVFIKARTPLAIAALDANLARHTPWKRGA